MKNETNAVENFKVQVKLIQGNKDGKIMGIVIDNKMPVSGLIRCFLARNTGKIVFFNNLTPELGIELERKIISKDRLIPVSITAEFPRSLHADVINQQDYSSYRLGGLVGSMAKILLNT